MVNVYSKSIGSLTSWSIMLLALLLIEVSHAAMPQRKIPELWGQRVHDEANVLNEAEVDELEKKLKAFEDSTSNQIAILIIPSLDGDILEEYALRVAEHWKLGQQGKDNGALLLISVQDHKIRIETGRGLEGSLTDVICNRIIRNEMAPAFRKDSYIEGLRAATDAMIAATKGEYSADGDESTFYHEEMSWKVKLLVALFLLVSLGTFSVIGILTPGCAGWFLYVFLIPFYGLFPLAFFGTITGIATVSLHIILYPLIKFLIGRSKWGKKVGKKFGPGSGGRTGRSGWSGGSSGWSSGSSSSSSGGFSGGGGSFGGGGSSGSW